MPATTATSTVRWKRRRRKKEGGAKYTPPTGYREPLVGDLVTTRIEREQTEPHNFVPANTKGRVQENLGLLPSGYYLLAVEFVVTLPVIAAAGGRTSKEEWVDVRHKAEARTRKVTRNVTNRDLVLVACFTEQALALRD